MDAPTYVPDTALPQYSSAVPLSSGILQVNVEVPPEEGAIRYVCFQCHTSYAQPQGLQRHNRTTHDPKLCFLCGFSWGRPYEYRAHLIKVHPGVNPDVILGKPAGSRRRSTIITEHLPQQPPVLPPSEKIAYAEQTVAMYEHEYPHGSEFLDAAYPLSRLLSTKESAEPMNDLGTSLHGQSGLPSAPDGSTPTHSSETAPTPTPLPGVGENHGALVSAGPMAGPAHYSPLSEAEIDAIFDSIFTNSTFWG